MKRICIIIVGLLCAVSVFAGEPIIDLDRVFQDEITKKYGTDWASWIMQYPEHPVVDVSGTEPKIHNGHTITWRHFDPERAEWACLFRIQTDGSVVGRYLYDNRVKAPPVNEDSVILLLKQDAGEQKK